MFAIGHDLLPDAKNDFYEWHNREHIPERLGIPGFNRGRRYIAVRGICHVLYSNGVGQGGHADPALQGGARFPRGGGAPVVRTGAARCRLPARRGRCAPVPRSRRCPTSKAGIALFMRFSTSAVYALQHQRVSAGRRRLGARPARCGGAS